MVAGALACMLGCIWPGEEQVEQCSESSPGVSKRSAEHRVFGGSDEPTTLPLEDGQILAIGLLHGCSGALISDRWVITARHCPVEDGDRFCIGPEPDNPDRCIAIARVVEHPTADLILAELAEDPRKYHPKVSPIPIMTEMMDCGWLGEMAEAAGYGVTERGDHGTRLFIAEPIVEMSQGLLTIDGFGESGLCRGDSGGPVMVMASDATVRVAGTLSFGHISCRRHDRFTRLDRVQEWILDQTGESHRTRTSGQLY